VLCPEPELDGFRVAAVSGVVVVEAGT
jgi:hypothetical protein